MWAKDDPVSSHAAVFENDEIEEFLAYADNSKEFLVGKACLLLYLSCAGRKGELNDVCWSDVFQKNVGGKLLWHVKYVREKVVGRPEVVESVLGDDVTNLIFSLYAGLISLFSLLLFYAFFAGQIVSFQ